MKPIIKLYLKTILLIAVPYGIILALFEVIGSEEFFFWNHFAKSLSFGVIMSLVLIPVHIAELKRLKITKFTDEVLASNQKKELSTILTKEELIHKLRSNPKTKNMNLKESGNLIVLKTKPSWKCWGEKVQIKLGELDNGVKQVLISSKSKLLVPHLDFGKNWENIYLIETILKKTL